MSSQKETDSPGLIRFVEPAHPAYVEAKDRAETIQGTFMMSGLAVLGGLEADVAHMPISSRFSATRKVEENVPPAGTMNTHLSESEYKREQLRRDIEAARVQLVILASRVKDLVMDIEATKID